jgi:hypothetical protein
MQSAAFSSEAGGVHENHPCGVCIIILECEILNLRYGKSPPSAAMVHRSLTRREQGREIGILLKKKAAVGDGLTSFLLLAIPAVVMVMVARIVGEVAMMVGMIIAVVAVMVVVMMIAIPSCGWNRAAGCDCANNT